MKKLMVICFLIFASESRAAAANVLDKLPFLGMGVGFHERRGFLDFGNGRTEELEKSNLLTGGAVLGKRWCLVRRLRLQTSVNINYGTVVDDTLLPMQLSDNSYQSTLLTTAMFFGGAVASLQYPFYASPDASWFVQVGGGVHIAKMSESEALLDDPKQRVLDDGGAHRLQHERPRRPWIRDRDIAAVRLLRRLFAALLVPGPLRHGT